jgi:hypothetical protein
MVSSALKKIVRMDILDGSKDKLGMWRAMAQLERHAYAYGDHGAGKAGKRVSGGHSVHHAMNNLTMHLEVERRVNIVISR